LGHKPEGLIKFAWKIKLISFFRQNQQADGEDMEVPFGYSQEQIDEKAKESGKWGLAGAHIPP